MEPLFNLSEESINYSHTNNVQYLIIYDIISNSRRTKFCKLLSGYGIRVQKSCFETYLDKSAYHKLEALISEFYSQNEEDNIIVYKLDKQEITRLNNEAINFYEDIIFL